MPPPAPAPTVRTDSIPFPRRAFHLTAGSLFPLAAFWLDRAPLLAAAGAVAGVFLLGELVRLRYPPANALALRWLRPLLKEDERDQVTGATFMMLATVLAFLLYPREVAVAGLLFLSLGDPVAGLVGSRFGRTRLLGKSLEGSLAFLGVCLAVAGLLRLGGLVSGFPLLAAGAAVATLVELLPLPMDDNFAVPVVSGGAMALLWT